MPCGIDQSKQDGANAALVINRLASQLSAYRAEKTDDGGNGGQTPDTQAPTVPSMLQLSGVTHNNISMSWQASTDNVAVTAYEVIRNGAMIATVGETRYSDQGLTPSTTYGYSIVAIDAAKNRSDQSNYLTATTKAAPPPPPVEDTEPPTKTNWSEDNQARQNIRFTGMDSLSGQ